MEYQAPETRGAEPRGGFRQPLAVACDAREGARDRPTLGRKHAAGSRVRQLNDLELETTRGCVLGHSPSDPPPCIQDTPTPALPSCQSHSALSG